MTRNAHRVRFFPLVLGLFALLPGLSAFGQTGIASADKAELWRQGSDQALAGDFSGAAKTFARVVELDPEDRKSQQALQWTQSVKELMARRSELRQEVLTDHLDAAQKLLKLDKPDRAIDHVRLARENTVDAASVLTLPWLDELVAKVKVQIAKHREKGEWADAYILYEILARVYKGSPIADEYDRESKFCAQRARFKELYRKDGDWKSRVTHISADMAEKMLQKIGEDPGYVVLPDFKAMVQAGIDYLRVLVDTPRVAEVFPQLDDPTATGDFLRRLDAEKRRIAEADSLNQRTAIQKLRLLLDINSSTIDLPTSVVVAEFMNGALSVLDEYTSPIWPSEVQEFNKHTHGAFYGVGIQITKGDGEFIKVETPLEDTPACEAGIVPGDLITAVDGVSTQSMKLTDAVQTIQGPAGSKVVLTIKRPGQDEPFDVPLARKLIKIVSVKGFERDDHATWDYMIDPTYRIAYVRISQFTESTVSELKAALNRIRDAGGQGLILDLRFNPGGLLTSAIQTCELFLTEKEPIVKTRGRHPKMNSPPVNADVDGDYSGTDMIVLVNQYSASASEIVAGTLSGNNRAYIIGERTFGKGSVQNLYPIEDRALFKLTTAHYYIPMDPDGETWRCLHKEPKAESWGVEPNLKVELIPQEIEKVLKLRRRKDIIGGGLETKEPPKPPATQPEDEIVVENKAPDIDPQLETALSLMRMKLVSRQPWVLAPRTVVKEAAGG